MDSKKQKILVDYLISSPDTFALCQGLVKADFFDPELRNAVTFIKNYYEKYNTTPSVDQVDAESGIKFTKREITPDEIKYCTDEVATFCRHRAMEKAILASPELLAKGDYGAVETSIREAILLTLNRDLGLSYFDDVNARLTKMLNENPTEPTGWSEVDELLFGGISRQEMFLVSANSGGGKSITLANLAFNFVNRGRDVLYISLELSEPIVGQRFDTMYTGIGRRDWKGRTNEIVSRVTSEKEKGAGRLVIKQMPSGTSAADIRAYLKEYYLKYKKYPDLLVLDYLDNMSPNEFVSADNVWEKDKRCSEQFRQILVDYNMFGATASQLNREAVKATHHDHSHIAGGISKINVSDVYISIKMTESMRAAGEIMFSLQKTRNSDGVGKNVFLKWDSRTLRITDGDGSAGGTKTALSFVSKKDKAPKNDIIDTPTGGGLLDLLSSTT